MCVQAFVKVLCLPRTRLLLCRSFCVAIFGSHEFTRVSHDFHEFRAKTCMTSSSRKIATANAARFIFVPKKDESCLRYLAYSVASLKSPYPGRTCSKRVRQLESFSSHEFRSFSHEIREIRENRGVKRFSEVRFRLQNATLGFLQTRMAIIIAYVCTRLCRCHIPRSLSLCAADMPFRTFFWRPTIFTIFARFCTNFVRLGGRKGSCANSAA
jgi:hypothetical protein